MSSLDPDELSYVSSFYDKSFEEEYPSIYAELRTISDRYQVQKKLASGGMKEIFLCHDSATDRQVAKAVLIDHSQHEAVEDFLREARITARLQHPNIIPVYDIAKDEDGCPFFTMKNIEGKTLTQYRKEHPIRDDFKETWGEILNMFLKISEAIAFAHSKGILHLDIKPDNIQVSQYGEILVCDWGLARIKGSTVSDEALADYMIHETKGRNLTLNGLVQGSPGYMAPEQADPTFGEKDELTDVYSLGCLLYYLITGRTAISASSLKDYIELLKKGEFKIPSELNSVPEGVEAICLKAMSVQKQDRYVNVNEIIHDVQAYLLGFAPMAEKAGFLKQCQLFYRRNQKACVTALFFLILLFCSGVFYTAEINHSRRNTERALVEVQKTNDEKTELILWYKNGIMNSAIIAYKRQEYNTALNILEDLNFVDAKRLKVEIYMIKQDFVKAMELLDGVGSRSLEDALGFITSLRMDEQGYLHKESIVKILKTQKIHNKYKRQIIHYHMEFIASQQERFEIVADLLKVINGLDELKMKVESRENGWYVDLSDNQGLRKSNYIEFLGDVDHLNVSNTGLNSLKNISKLSLRVLEARKIPVNTLGTWVNPYLEEIDFAGAALQQTPNLKYLRSLKKLTLPLRLQNKPIDRYLRKVEISYLP